MSNRILGSSFRELVVTVLILHGGLIATARADGPGNITQAEWGLLPEYCYYTQLSPGFSDRVRVSAWYDRMGRNNFHAMHHYCWGLIWQMRAERNRFRSQPHQYKFMLDKAFQEMEYVVKHTEPTFRLRPEILTRQGRVLRLAGRSKEAADVFTQALGLLPSYWPASVGLGEVFIEAGRADLALKVAESALQISPGVRPLNDLKASASKAKSVAAPASKAQPDWAVGRSTPGLSPAQEPAAGQSEVR